MRLLPESASALQASHPQPHTRAQPHRGLAGTHASKAYTHLCGDEVEEGGRGRQGFLAVCTLLSFLQAHVWPFLISTTLNLSLPTTFHFRLLPFSSAQLGGHRKGLPVSHLIPKAPSQRWVCC